jgi:hypothetical protein
MYMHRSDLISVRWQGGTPSDFAARIADVINGPADLSEAA